MSKKIKIPLKIAVFIVGFYVLSVAVAFCLRDDSSSYARILMHELYEQDGIDYLYCGASHVSHGITPKVADEMFGGNNFSTGTAGQNIQGTYAILKQALKLYSIKKVFVELDFAVAIKSPVAQKTGFKPDYLIAKYIRDPAIRYDFLFSLSSPRYYVNSLLPIGKDKYMTFQPKALANRFKSIVSGDYFNYVYKCDDDEYDGKGCLLDFRPVKNGTFSSTAFESPIPVQSISSDWIDTVDKIIALCKEYDTELIFYSQPCTDFYLHEKGNYDEYYSFAKEFTKSRGFEYYDFNLAKEKYQNLEDEDFHDDNHFSKLGVYKWTAVFCNYFLGNIPKDDMFYDSYAQKIAEQPDRIYGLYLITSDDHTAIDITPVVNHVSGERITYTVSADCGNGEIDVLSENSAEPHIVLPQGKIGTVHVKSYLDGNEQNVCKTRFNTTF